MDVSDLHRRPAPLDECATAHHGAPFPCERRESGGDGSTDLGAAGEPPQTPPTDLYVAGLVVHLQPSRLKQVESAIAGLPGAEVHGVSLLGKLAVTLEHTREAALTEQLRAISGMRGVLSAVIVYQHSEPLIEVDELIDISPAHPEETPA